MFTVLTTSNPSSSPASTPSPATIISGPLERGKRKQTSDELERSSKKAKVAEEPGFARHPVFWTKNVSVFLQFGDTRMKLNRGRLASRSRWFQELLEQKGVSKNGSRLDIPWSVEDGVDVFKMDKTGISLKDFEALLTTMEDGLTYCYNKPSFGHVVSLVRTAYFFEFETVLGFATTFMEKAFPAELKEVPRTGCMDFTQAAEAVLLGRNYGLPQLLKRAFYELGRAADPEVYDLEGGHAHPFHELDHLDVVLVMNLQKRLVTTWLEIVTSDRIDGSCPKKPACPKFRCVDPAVDLGYINFYRFDPIMGIEELKQVNWTSYGLCSGCAKGRVKWLDGRMTELWEEIDGWIELESLHADASLAEASPAEADDTNSDSSDY